MGVLIPVAVSRDYAVAPTDHMVAPERSLKEDACGCTSCGVDKNIHNHVYRDSAAAPLHLESKDRNMTLKRADCLYLWNRADEVNGAHSEF